MKEFKWRLLIIVVITFCGFGFADSSPLESEDSQKNIASDISTESKELHQKLKEGCEIDAYFKQGDSKCEIIIRIKDDFKEKMLPHSPEFERAINVELLKGFFPKNSADRVNAFTDGDSLVYKTYKNKSKMPGVFHYHQPVRRLKRVDLDTKIVKHGFTYAEFFKAAEELLYQNESKLGKGNLLSTKRVFKEIIPDQRFLLSPPRALRVD